LLGSDPMGWYWECMLDPGVVAELAVCALLGIESIGVSISEELLPWRFETCMLGCAKSLALGKPRLSDPLRLPKDGGLVMVMYEGWKPSSCILLRSDCKGEYS
jgi:hypothetical protein